MDQELYQNYDYCVRIASGQPADAAAYISIVVAMPVYP